jgi:hypothetical protein
MCSPGGVNRDGTGETRREGAARIAALRQAAVQPHGEDRVRRGEIHAPTGRSPNSTSAGNELPSKPRTSGCRSVGSRATATAPVRSIQGVAADSSENRRRVSAGLNLIPTTRSILVRRGGPSPFQRKKTGCPTRRHLPSEMGRRSISPPVPPGPVTTPAMACARTGTGVRHASTDAVPLSPSRHQSAVKTRGRTRRGKIEASARLRECSRASGRKIVRLCPCIPGTAGSSARILCRTARSG